MPQLRRGARSQIDLIKDSLGAIRQYATEARNNSRKNPLVVQDAALDIITEAITIERILREEIEPLLQRSPSATVKSPEQEQIDQLRQALEDLKVKIEQPSNITRLKREGI